MSLRAILGANEVNVAKADRGRARRNERLTGVSEARQENASDKRTSVPKAEAKCCLALRSNNIDARESARTRGLL